jgi:ATP-dependent Lhr-like helicase
MRSCSRRQARARRSLRSSGRSTGSRLTRLRELLDADVVADLELELQRLAPTHRHCRSPDDLHDLLRALGDLSDAEVAARCQGDATAWLATLAEERRAIRIRVAGEARAAAAEDAARYRDALGAACPAGLPGVFTEPVPDPLGDLLGRYARTHAPFSARDAAARFGLPVDEVRSTLARLEAGGRVAHGEFRPGGVEREW